MFSFCSLAPVESWRLFPPVPWYTLGFVPVCSLCLPSPLPCQAVSAPVHRYGLCPTAAADMLPPATFLLSEGRDSWPDTVIWPDTDSRKNTLAITQAGTPSMNERSATTESHWDEPLQMSELVGLGLGNCSSTGTCPAKSQKGHWVLVTRPQLPVPFHWQHWWSHAERCRQSTRSGNICYNSVLLALPVQSAPEYHPATSSGFLGLWYEHCASSNSPVLQGALWTSAVQVPSTHPLPLWSVWNSQYWKRKRSPLVYSDSNTTEGSQPVSQNPGSGPLLSPFDTSGQIVYSHPWWRPRA